MLDFSTRLRRAGVAIVALLVLGAPPVALADGSPSTPGLRDQAPSGPVAASDCLGPFSDVGCDHRFAGEIGWAAREGIATGYPDGSYGATAAVTRQGFAAFLHRYSGSPEGPFDDPGYSDVGEDHVFSTEISWLASTGATTGYSDGSFRPTAPVSRQAAAAMLHRLLGPDDDEVGEDRAGEQPFTDVDADHLFAEEIGWLVDDHAQGYEDGTFRPTLPVSRQAAAAMLFRDELVGPVRARAEGGCETLGAGHCMLPFPSDSFTTSVPVGDVGPVGTSGTGLRIDVDDSALPGSTVMSADLAGNDGFSPGQPLLLQVPGVDPAVSGLAPITDPSLSLLSDAPIVIVDTVTGERVPYIAEVDMTVGDEARRPLIVRPAVNYQEGHRHVVGVRGLRGSDGALLPTSPTFISYRDAAHTPIDEVEERRAAMEGLLGDLTEAGVDRHDLQLAWEFTVASEQNLSERVLSMRDRAFADLGGEAPGFTIDVVEVDPSAEIARRITGTVEVPNFLEGEGGPGSRMRFGDDGLPESEGVRKATFTCIVPVTATSDEPADISLFGHGLLGRGSDVWGFRRVAQDHNTVFCGADWIGMSNPDLPVVAGILANFSDFAVIPDRGQQGLLEFLFLGRLMAHSEGLATHAAFQDEGEPLIDTSRLLYVGGSQGGIMGGALTAIAQDFTDAVLAVPGMNYSTMLRRSSNWPTFAAIMALGYPDEVDRTVLISLAQMLWDRSESNGYAHHITDDPYPGTPAHRVFLFEAFADHQVANYATEVMARTVGARARRPVIDDGRSPVLDHFWGLETVEDGYTGSVVVMWDWGTPAPPVGNEPPFEGSDPHGNVGDAQETVAQAMLLHFLTEGEFLDLCGEGACKSP